MDQINVQVPGKIDIFVHNHNILNLISWFFVALMMYAVITSSWTTLAVSVIAAGAARSMALLLCGWLHAWAALEMLKAKKVV